MNNWWERYPGLEQTEINSLHEAGIEFEKDQVAWNNNKLVLHIKFPVKLLNIDFQLDKEVLVLEAHYPDTYPFFKPEVFAKDEALERHQNPFDKNLCLIGRSTDNWNSDWKIADFLQSQLTRIFKINKEGAGTEFSDANEEHQGEPFSEYLPFSRSGEVFHIGDWKIPEHIKYGSLKVGILDLQPVRGVVLEVRDEKNNVFESLPYSNLDFSKIITVPWVHLTKPIPTSDLNLYVSTLTRLHPSYDGPKIGKQSIGAFVFPEEGKWKTDSDGWVFFVATPKYINKKSKRKRAKHRSNVNKIAAHGLVFVRAQRADKSAISDRIPELSTLENKKALLFGLGSIGAPIALELARAGIGEIVLIDYDIAEVGPSVRWPFGLEFSGKLKCEILRDFICKNYPNIKVKIKNWRLGDASQNETQNMNDIINNASIIIDATAEYGIQHFLSDYAIELKIPYIWVVGRHGGWGGIVGRIVPERTKGCWLCYTHLRNDNNIIEPPSSPENMVQPTGCADPTFTGTGFDMTTIALTGVRVIVSTLCNDTDEGYPDIDEDVITISFRDVSGAAITPRFLSQTILVHPNCSRCSK